MSRLCYVCIVMILYDRGGGGDDFMLLREQLCM